jgi:hypothetical protein
MQRHQYQQYLDSFNDCDYDKVLAFWAPEFVVTLQGEVLFDSAESLKRTYAFLHDHVTEEIFVQHYLADADKVFLEAIVRITAHKSITAQALATHGIRGVLPMEAGVAIDIPQFIHYQLEKGRFKTGACLISGVPQPVVPR